MKSTSNGNVVLVTGGTGSQGGATVTHLLAAKKARVRVLTRNLESPKAKSLAARGVELVKGDFEDVASLRTALAGVSAAFSVQQWTEKGGTAAEELNGKRFADAVKASGSPHLVYSSAEGAERKSGLGHYGHKPWVAPIPTFAAKVMMPKEFADMFRWIREKGFEANISQARQEYPQLLTFAGWLKKYTDTSSPT
jgi:nucleoside-diphosphate-sugar epimerase